MPLKLRPAARQEPWRRLQGHSMWQWQQGHWQRQRTAPEPDPWCNEDSCGGAGSATAAQTEDERRDSGRAVMPVGDATGYLGHNESRWHWSSLRSKPPHIWRNGQSWSLTSCFSRLFLQSEALSIEETDGQTPSEDPWMALRDMRISAEGEVGKSTMYGERKFPDARVTNSPLEACGT